MLHPEESDDRWLTGPLVEALHLGLAAAALKKLGIFEALSEACDADTLAKSFKIDPEILGGTLEYLSCRTQLVETVGGRYQRGSAYDVQAKFLLELYGGAFAPNAANLDAIMKQPDLAFETVDRAAQARAFANASQQSISTIAGIVQQLGFNNLLDLGCGSGLLLSALAEQNPRFVGWGIDMNSDMCSAAQKRIKSVAGHCNIKIEVGNVHDIEGLLSENDRAAIQTIYAGDVINEMFRGGGKIAIEWLQKLQAEYPGRTFVVSDYYGQLNSQNASADSLMLLHDFSQIISGQGVPPPDLEGWTPLYEIAGCRFVHAIEDEKSSRFIHIVQL